jgi:probable rRNA maturation factor
MPRRRSAGRVRLAVTLTSPDGASLPIRGLAAWLTKAAPPAARGEVTVALVSDARMRTLNRSYRNKDYATDVLSFPALAPAAPRRALARGSVPAKAPAANTGRRTRRRTEGPPAAFSGNFPTDNYLGDIVIAAGVAQRQAEEVGHPVSTELKVLALHGLLHLLGYDHETDAGTMARVEARLRRKAGLKEGLIARQPR